MWRERLGTNEAAQALAIAQRCGLPDVVGRVLAGRGIALDEAEAFLAPSIKNLMVDPSLLVDMDRACEVVVAALQAGKKLAIFGDYDVDGATSSSMLQRYFRMLGVDVDVYIPDRIIDGYGPNPTALAQLHAQGAQLLISVDCGSTSFEAFEHARTLGLEVVVLDHHQVGENLPQVAALVNPNRQDDLSGQGHLAAVGVSFLFLVALNRALRQLPEFAQSALPDLMQLLDLVALGTVCDVVPLKGLNRAYVVKGLQVMAKRGNVGLATLADIARVNGKPTPYHLGYMLGPRINAGGRIGDSGLGARLLAGDDRNESEHIAATLERLNQERQAMEAIMLEEGEAQAFQQLQAGEPAVLVVGSDSWHPGVVGLIASRLKERYRRPAFAVAFNKEGVGTASGRSVNGVDLGACVRAAVDRGLLLKGGGHAMAAGMSLSHNKLAQVIEYFNENLAEEVARALAQRALVIDGVLTPGAAKVELIELLEHAGPYGADHPEPVFAMPSVFVKYADIVGKGHVRVTLGGNDGSSLKAIAFKAEDQNLGKMLLANRGRPLHVAGSLSIDTWQGQAKVQMRIIDAAEPQKSQFKNI
ncbi:single-stranded-DNA-specific exonuclease RecJ [Polycladidibacter stylochi]|uniref:single-stranded-DNA-specific exonuclease RecJ n=1 Tax=Polycladidibacter stylochi TaxID=1807766 RepID=UPI0009E82394|nr:single-stranded-DNA-specific exonuclease RecJ [Pseudovibrio stylochi]